MTSGKYVEPGDSGRLILLLDRSADMRQLGDRTARSLASLATSCVADFCSTMNEGLHVTVVGYGRNPKGPGTVARLWDSLANPTALPPIVPMAADERPFGLLLKGLPALLKDAGPSPVLVFVSSAGSAPAGDRKGFRAFVETEVASSLESDLTSVLWCGLPGREADARTTDPLEIYDAIPPWPQQDLGELGLEGSSQSSLREILNLAARLARSAPG